jgi:superfamily I DNA and/or RNA helicase
MLEPLSLVPLTRFGCARLVLFLLLLNNLMVFLQLAAGDPMQLPPTLNTFNDERAEEGLAKTLFVRLVSLGYEPIMLRTQYRVGFS